MVQKVRGVGLFDSFTQIVPPYYYYLFQFIYPIVLWDYLETTVQKQDTVNYGRENKAKSSKGQRLIQW